MGEWRAVGTYLSSYCGENGVVLSAQVVRLFETGLLRFGSMLHWFLKR